MRDRKIELTPPSNNIKSLHLFTLVLLKTHSLSLLRTKGRFETDHERTV